MPINKISQTFIRYRLEVVHMASTANLSRRSVWTVRVLAIIVLAAGGSSALATAKTAGPSEAAGAVFGAILASAIVYVIATKTLSFWASR